MTVDQTTHDAVIEQAHLIDTAVTNIENLMVVSTDPPPVDPAPTVSLATEVAIFDAGRVLVTAIGHSSEPPSAWTYWTDDPTAVLATSNSWYVGRSPDADRNVTFTLTATKEGHEPVGTASVAVIPMAGGLPPIPPVEPVPPASYVFEIPAEEMRMVNRKSMVLETTKPGHTGAGSIGYWGSLGEAVEFDIYVLTDDTVPDELVLRYGNGGTVPSTRVIRLIQGGAVLMEKEMEFPNEGQWASPDQWREGICDAALPKGRYTIHIECITEGEYLDLDHATIRSSQNIEGSEPTPTPPVVIPDPPVPPSTGDLAHVLDVLFPSDGSQDVIQWKQGINGAQVPAGRTLVLKNGEVSGGEWIIRGLRGRPDAWITIKAETPLGLRARELEVWRGLGIYDGQYVRVDGIDGYGTGRHNPDGSGDFTSMIEAIGGHHIAVTRCRANNTGGHCVSASWGEGMNAPSNVYILYNVAYDTSKRNPFNGSAFNVFHGTSKRPGDGPLAALGFTDYIIGNVAFGCRSEVADPNWGITDGNCFILDVGRDSGYDGTCLVAFNVGADNGGRGVHTLQTDGLQAFFNTMVGNQTNVTEPASGEFSPHTDNGQRCVTRGNIAAATVRNPAVWYQDWQGGHGGHAVSENVVLAGTADPPNNVPVNPAGIAYLKGASTKSRTLDDYRPVSGTPLIDADLITMFGQISAAFPDASGKWRHHVIAGALDDAG